MKLKFEKLNKINLLQENKIQLLQKETQAKNKEYSILMKDFENVKMRNTFLEKLKAIQEIQLVNIKKINKINFEKLNEKNSNKK